MPAEGRLWPSDDDDEGVGVGGDDCNVGGKSVLFPGLSSAGAEAAREPCIFIIIIITGNGHGNFHWSILCIQNLKNPTRRWYFGDTSAQTIWKGVPWSNDLSSLRYLLRCIIRLQWKSPPFQFSASLPCQPTLLELAQHLPQARRTRERTTAQEMQNRSDSFGFGITLVTNVREPILLNGYVVHIMYYSIQYQCVDQ